MIVRCRSVNSCRKSGIVYRIERVAQSISIAYASLHFCLCNQKYCFQLSLFFLELFFFTQLLLRSQTLRLLLALVQVHSHSPLCIQLFNIFLRLVFFAGSGFFVFLKIELVAAVAAAEEQ